MTDAPPDLLTIETFAPLVGQEFSILHPQVPAEFKLRLAPAYGRSKGRSRPPFRKPLSLTFRGPVEPLLLEGLYDIQTEGFGPVSLYIIPSLTPDREENGMGYHIAIN